MIETKYICNICKDKYDKPKGSDASLHTIFELYYKWGESTIGRQRMHVRPISDETHNHICKNCLLDIIETAPAGITLPTKARSNDLANNS